MQLRWIGQCRISLSKPTSTHHDTHTSQHDDTQPKPAHVTSQHHDTQLSHTMTHEMKCVYIIMTSIFLVIYYSRPSLIRIPLLRNLANPKCRHKLKIILIIDFEFKGHVMRMRITYSSCKLLIMFVRKLTKAYKVNRIATTAR